MSDLRAARDRLDRIVSLLLRTYHHFWVAFGVLVLGCGLSLALAVTRPRVYHSETLILYREGIGARALVGGEWGGDPSRKLGLKLKEMVLSRTRLERIIDHFKLYPQLVNDRGNVDAVDEMRKHISFSAKDVVTFGLGFEGEDPVCVQKVTAQLAEELLEDNSKSRVEQAGVTKGFLDVEKAHAETDLRAKETLLAQFLSKHPEFAREANGVNAGTQTGIAIRAAAQEKAGQKTTDPALLALEREAGRLQARLGLPSRKAAVAKETDPRLLAARNEAEADLRAVQRELTEKLSQFTEEHPDVRAAKGRVRVAEAKLKRASDAVVAAEGVRTDRGGVDEERAVDRATLANELRKVNDAMASYRAKVKRKSGDEEKPSADANRIVALETEWTQINRDVTDARERTQQLEDRQFKASIVESAAALGSNAQMVIVDPAYKPTHPNQGRSKVAVAGGAVSLLLALLIALFRALMDDRLYDRVDVETLDTAPLLCVVPAAKRSKRG
jgi:uncharacterized protein involved in exopolysaccharide biosynthesis